MNQFGSEKILKHLDRVVDWQNTGISRPITYELDMTNVCNSKCPFCFGFYDQSKDQSSLTLNEAKDIITQIKDFGGKGLTFTGGGDPLCNGASIEAVRYARTIGLDVGFITNGILLNDANVDRLVDNCTWIRVSMDAGNEDTYRLTHGLNGETFKKVVMNVKKLVESKKKRRSGVTIGTGFLTFGEVIEDMESFVVLSRKLGVDYAQFRPLLRKPGEKERNDKSDNRVIGAIKKCSKYSNTRFNVLFSVHKYESMKNGEAGRLYGACYGHNFAAVVAANKKMYLCCHVRGIEKYCIGDLSINCLKSIWKSRKRKKVYDNIDFKDCPLLCRCDGFNNILWNICRGSEHVNFL